MIIFTNERHVARYKKKVIESFKKYNSYIEGLLPEGRKRLCNA